MRRLGVRKVETLAVAFICVRRHRICEIPWLGVRCRAFLYEESRRLGSGGPWQTSPIMPIEKKAISTLPSLRTLCDSTWIMGDDYRGVTRVSLPRQTCVFPNTTVGLYISKGWGM
jgi:hypothetical protein